MLRRHSTSLKMAGDPAKSIDYYKQCFRYAVPFIYLWSHIADMADAYLQLYKYDSALYYQQLNKQMLAGAAHDTGVFNNFSSSWGFTSGWRLAGKPYDTALQQLLPVVNLLRNSRDVIPYMQVLFTLGKIYEAKKNYQRSLVYARELYQVAKQISNKQWLKEGNELLSSVFSNIKNTDSAFFYYRQYVALKDSMETAQYAGRTALYIAASEAENRISLLSKDEEQMSRFAGKLHFILDAVSAQHDINLYLNLLRVDGLLALVGAPEHPFPVAAFSLIPYRRSFAGSMIGGIAETQEMLDFCGKHGIVSDIEIINIQQINEAYERLLKGDVKYRFVIDMTSLKK